MIPPGDVASLDGYDAVIIGSAVYMGHWLDPAKDLVSRFGDALAGRLVWLFSSGPVGDPSGKLAQAMGSDPLTSPRCRPSPTRGSTGCSLASSVASI